MSYILDALRKSEQERLRDQPLSTLGHTPVVAAKDGRPRWLLPLLAANLVVLTMLGVWWLRSLATPTQETPSVSASATSADVAANPTAAPPTTIDTQAGNTTILTPNGAAAATAPDESAEGTQLGLSNAAYENVGEWDANTAASATWRLTTHVYSSDRAARAVVIDGVRLREGERHPSGLRVVTITPTGARVEVNGEESELELGQ